MGRRNDPVQWWSPKAAAAWQELESRLDELEQAERARDQVAQRYLAALMAALREDRPAPSMQEFERYGRGGGYSGNDLYDDLDSGTASVNSSNSGSTSDDTSSQPGQADSWQPSAYAPQASETSSWAASDYAPVPGSAEYDRIAQEGDTAGRGVTLGSAATRPAQDQSTVQAQLPSQIADAAGPSRWNGDGGADSFGDMQRQQYATADDASRMAAITNPPDGPVRSFGTPLPGYDAMEAHVPEGVEAPDTSKPFLLFVRGVAGDDLRRPGNSGAWGSMIDQYTRDGKIGGYGFYDWGPPTLAGNLGGWGDASTLNPLDMERANLDRAVQSAHDHGFRNIVLVGHSRGGVLIDDYLANLAERQDPATPAQQAITGAATLSSPLDGPLAPSWPVHFQRYTVPQRGLGNC